MEEEIARDFAARARRFCELCERPPAEPEHAARELIAALGGLVGAAAVLPELEPSAEPDPAREPQPSALPDFGEADHYRVAFDPYEDDDPVMGSLRDDLGDIYVDLRLGLAILERESEDAVADALFCWRFGFESHWGQHATGALRALYWIARSRS